jgi:hypothetical protein
VTLPREYWCASCRRRTGDLDELGKPAAGWYKVVQSGSSPPNQGDIRPGWYCGLDCLLLVAMVAIGIDEQEAVAWLRGEPARSV